MKIHDVQQGSQAWLDLHVGVLTSSRFHRLMTERTRKPAKGEAVHKLACELSAEFMMGQLLDGGTSQFMARGNKLEDRAISAYEFDNAVEVERVGFITLDSGEAGCSPDGLIGNAGGLEIKCPSPAKHVENLWDPQSFEDQYYAQCQGGMWVCDRRWWHLVSYHPTIPGVMVPIARDSDYIEALAEQVRIVNAEVDSILRTHGFKE